MAMLLSHGLHPSLRGTLVVVATVAMVIAIAAMVVSVTQEVALLRWGGVMTVCDDDKVRVYAANNASTDTTAE